MRRVARIARCLEQREVRGAPPTITCVATPWVPTEISTSQEERLEAAEVVLMAEAMGDEIIISLGCRRSRNRRIRRRPRRLRNHSMGKEESDLTQI